MRKKEQLLWDAMRMGLSPGVHLERIENSAGEGIADVVALCAGVVTFCELKARADFPARASSRVLGSDGLRQAQKNWHMIWNKHGGRSLIIIGVGTGRHRQHLAVRGGHGDALNEMAWAELLSASCAVGAGAEFWPRLEEVLRKQL